MQTRRLFSAQLGFCPLNLTKLRQNQILIKETQEMNIDFPGWNSQKQPSSRAAKVDISRWHLMASDRSVNNACKCSMMLNGA